MSTESDHEQFTATTTVPPASGNFNKPPQPYSIFDRRQKAVIVVLASTAATFSGFASNIYFPALPTIASDLDVSIELVNLTVTSYLIFQGLAPSLWGPISDVYGRRVAYMGTFLVFVGACVGLGLTSNYATLVVLRCLQSTGSASTIAIGSGVIGDIATQEERGSYMGIFQAGLLVPVAVGPVIGGALAGNLGWRSVFWFLAIYAGVFLLCLVVLLPETLRSLVSNGSRAQGVARWPLVVYQKSTRIEFEGVVEVGQRKKVDLLGPFGILVSRQAAPLIVFLAVYYAVWQMSITAMSTLFERYYQLTQTEVGLTFLANGVGSMAGTLLSGRLLDKDYARVKAHYQAKAVLGSGSQPLTFPEDDFPLERARLRLVPIFAGIQCFSIVLFGWTIHYPENVPIAIPIITTFVTGWTVVSTQSIIMTYLVDVFPKRAATASASLNLARCLLAAGGTSFVMPMINEMGVGWAFTVCVFVQFGSLSLVLVAWKYGAKWRRQAAVGSRTNVPRKK